MGHLNQLYFLAQHYKRDEAIRIVEIGSKNYGSTVPWRKAFPNATYVGIDAEAGDNVDIVADITRSTEAIPRDGDLYICCSVLEHVAQPWRAADHITTVMRPGAALYVSVPWVWRYHPYPDDYWRFSAAGVRELFPLLDFKAQVFSTYVEGDFYPAIEGMDDELSRGDDKGGKYLPYLEIHSLGIR